MLKRFQLWKFSKTRTEAFSDGVFAIIITLLVLEIKVPHLESYSSSHELFETLREMFPKMVSWAISFFFVAVMWVQHHNVFRMAERIDYGMVWMNNLFLFSLSFLPFPTALLGEYPSNQLAVLLFGINSTVASFLLNMLYFKVAQHHLSAPFDKEKMMKNVRKSFLLAPFPLLLAIGFSFISLWIPYLIYSLVPFFFLLPFDNEKDTEGHAPIPF